MTQKTHIVNLGKATVDLLKGDIVKKDAAGIVIKVTSAVDKLGMGVVYEDTLAGFEVSVVVAGEVSVRVLVEDTDGAGTYKTPITYGSPLVISGKVAGTFELGQAFSTLAAPVAGSIFGKSLGVEAGSASEDTYTLIKAFVNFRG